MQANRTLKRPYQAAPASANAATNLSQPTALHALAGDRGPTLRGSELPWSTARPLSWFGSALAALLLSLFNGPSPAIAGLCGSEVVVVVNAQSLNSRTLANHYISLRDIPAQNVIVLEDVPNSEMTTISEFREKILKPLLAQIDGRKLSGNVKCIAYSADFPTAIDITEELKPLGKLPQVYTRRASLNALTYLYQLVLAESPDYIQLDVNFYARRPLEHYFTSPAGKATEEAWAAIEQQIADGEHAAAADALEELLKEYPHQFPLAYLAAAQAALAEDSGRSIKLLKKAVSVGWNAGDYLAEDERFAAVRDESEIQILQLSLDDQIGPQQPSIAFESASYWAPNGVPSSQPNSGMRYLLSTVLGVTRGFGTSLPEAIACLERAAAADSTHPDGSFFFMDTKDVRTKTRQPGFAAAVSRLQAMGYKAEIVNSVLPMKEPAILGVQFGTPSFNWTKTGSTLAPGAIADNLTSFGGIMFGNAGQTKLSELIKVGAAGSSGTVVEPYAMQEKFPAPDLYVHYARGASLAEAFYQSVTGPYQLLIVGDPVCQPFSNAPRPELDTSPKNLRDKSDFSLAIKDPGLPYPDWLELAEPRAKRTAPIAATAVSIILDGQLATRLPSGPQLQVRTGGISPGYHEVRLKFASDDPLAQCSQATIPFWKGPPTAIRLTLPDDVLAAAKQLEQNVPQAAPSKMPELSLQSELLTVTLSATPTSSQGVKQVRLQHDSEVLESQAGEQAEFTIPLQRLGMGPVRLQAVAELDDGTLIHSVPKWIMVTP